MMKLYFTLTRKNLAIILATLIIAFVLIGQFFTVNAGEVDGSTNAKRVRFMQSLGITPNETAVEIKDIVIPESFSAVYEKYNSLQKESGFNLENYKGKGAAVYTYLLKDNTEKTVHLIICGDKIIGGDIADLNINGNMTGLRRKNE